MKKPLSEDPVRRSELIKSLKALSFLKQDDPQGVFYLTGTSYVFLIDDWDIWYFDARNKSDTSFEHILNDVEPKIREQLLFHLDLFT